MEAFDLTVASKVAGLIVLLAGGIAGYVRLQFRCAANEKDIADLKATIAGKASQSSVNELKDVNQKQWEFLTEGRTMIGEIKSSLVGFGKDVGSALQKACRVEKTLTEHMKENRGTIDRIWSEHEKLSNRVTRVEVKAGMNGGHS